ncbi:MAG: hypothetical protein IM613_17945 [Cytophagales bacterium]|nr:hypothetical protein [Cytophagales bacterium]
MATEKNILMDDGYLRPIMALVVYDGNVPNGRMYVEVAEFGANSDGGYQMMPGRPITKKEARRVGEALARGSQEFLLPEPGTVCPSNVLFYFGTESEPTVVWYQRAQTRKAWLSKETGIKGNLLPYPCLVFKVSKGDLSVYACADNDPQPTSPIFPLPLPNIYEDCTVCLGDARIERSKHLQTFIAGYERAFFDTEYNTFHGVEDHFKTVSIVNFWNRCIANKSFDTSIYEVCHHEKMEVKDLLVDY